MKNRLALFLFACYLLIHATVSAQVHELERAIPESEGVPSEVLIALMDSLTGLPETDIHSVMVLRHGKVIAEIYPEPFAPEYRHTMFSCSKTFLSAAVGIAIAENRLRLTDRVAAFFPNELPDTISTNLADMTVRHLLTMTSGVTPDWNIRNVRTDWVKGFLEKAVKTPGELFEYDSMSSYLLSAIMQKVTGMKLLDYLRTKLFQPMHITEAAWEVSPEGISTGGWGLHIQSESLAKFGQLLLNRGVWQGKQLLPAWWVEQMMMKQVDNGGDGYGYQMWCCEYPGASRADGALGQYILIVPDKDVVVVITECTLINGSTQRQLVWNRLFPAIGDQPLATGKDYKRLLKKQAEYRLPVVQGRANSNLSQSYAGKSIELEPNKYGWESLTLQFKQKELVMTVTEAGGATYDLPFGYKEWKKASINAYPPYSVTAKGRFCGIDKPFYVAGSYAWPSSSELKLKVHYVNWISALDLTLHMEGENIQLIVKENYSSGKGVMIKGKISN